MHWTNGDGKIPSWGSAREAPTGKERTLAPAPALVPINLANSSSVCISDGFLLWEKQGVETVLLS